MIVHNAKMIARIAGMKMAAMYLRDMGFSCESALFVLVGKAV